MGTSTKEALWQPALNIELSPLELIDLADAHLSRAMNAARNCQPEAQQFHEARAGYLREGLASIAPQLLTPQDEDDR
jgi:hypothetical protein